MGLVLPSRSPECADISHLIAKAWKSTGRKTTLSFVPLQSDCELHIVSTQLNVNTGFVNSSSAPEGARMQDQTTYSSHFSRVLYNIFFYHCTGKTDDKVVERKMQADHK